MEESPSSVQEVDETPRSYEEIMAPYLAELTEEERAFKDALDHAYEVSSQVIRLRLDLGLTQEQLAERCGIDQADISRIERGSVSPTVRTLQRIADALNADVRLVARAS